jgi:hypothetical protein
MGSPKVSVQRSVGSVAEWQTRRIQNPLPARACRFKSGRGHHFQFVVCRERCGTLGSLSLRVLVRVT